MSAIITAAEMTRYFLYGSTTETPEDLATEAMIPVDSGPRILTFDLSDYMTTGPGRFALASMSPVIQAFFTQELPDPQGQRQEYSLSQMQTLLSAADQFQVQQFSYSDGQDDRIERAYIFNNQQYELANSITFVVEANGDRHIEDLTIVPSAGDNFDFIGVGFSNGANLYLQPRIDPWNIGTRVDFHFSGTAPTDSYYDYSDFLADQANDANWYSAWGGVIDALASDLVESLFDAGITRFIDEDGRAIMYGSHEADEIDGSAWFEFAAPYLADAASTYGVNIIAGNGNDEAYGSSLGDVIQGNGDDDLLWGGEGNDILQGGEGRDALIGGDGVDELFGGDGDDVLVAGELDPEEESNPDSADLFDGGAGADSFVFNTTGAGQIVLQGGNTEDRLYLRADIVGLGGPGAVLFPLLGGMIADTEEPDTDEDGGDNYVFVQELHTPDGQWETTIERVFGMEGQDIRYNLS